MAPPTRAAVSSCGQAFAKTRARCKTPAFVSEIPHSSGTSAIMISVGRESAEIPMQAPMAAAYRKFGVW